MISSFQFKPKYNPSDIILQFFFVSFLYFVFSFFLKVTLLIGENWGVTVLIQEEDANVNQT